jgi:hypothetical protein
MTKGRHFRGHIITPLLWAGLCLAGAAGIEQVRARVAPLEPTTVAPLYIPPRPLLQRVSLGYNALAADFYWIRAIQYYGAERLRLAAASATDVQEPRAGFDVLFPLLDATTTLDPRFSVAYRFGAIFLAEPFPGGAGRPDLAVALLEKGLREQPDEWKYMLDIGYVYYWHRHDFRRAAYWFDQGSRMPGAPWWLRSLAAVTMAQGGDRRSSRAMWEGILESADLPYLRDQAERSLMQLRALDEMDALQQLVDRVSISDGVPPGDWTALLAARLLPAIPLDPSGTPYEIDSGARVRLAPDSPLHPLPNQPRPFDIPIS